MFYSPLSYYPPPGSPLPRPAVLSGPSADPASLRERYLAAAAEARVAEAQYLAAIAAAQRSSYPPVDPYGRLAPAPSQASVLESPFSYMAAPSYDYYHPGQYGPPHFGYEGSFFQPVFPPFASYPVGPQLFGQPVHGIHDASNGPQLRDPEVQRRAILPRVEEQHALGTLRRVASQPSIRKAQCLAQCPRCRPLPFTFDPPGTTLRGESSAAATPVACPCNHPTFEILSNNANEWHDHYPGLVRFPRRADVSANEHATDSQPTTGPPSNNAHLEALPLDELVKLVAGFFTKVPEAETKSLAPKSTSRPQACPRPSRDDVYNNFKVVFDNNRGRCNTQARQAHGQSPLQAQLVVPTPSPNPAPKQVPSLETVSSLLQTMSDNYKQYNNGEIPQIPGLAPLFDLFGSSPHPSPPAASSSGQASTRPAASEPTVSSSRKATLKEELDARLNNEYSTEVKDTIQALLASLISDPPTHRASNPAKASASSTSESSKPTDDTAALKEELSARLATEPASEVRDTIEALLASLSDSVPLDGIPQPQSPSVGTDAKGKGKAVDKPSVVPPVSDVSRALETVQTIETAFTALEADFVFPAQLDFTPPSSPAHIVAPLPGTENSDSVTRHLAYTARNQPLRYYEHALGELLAQLDLVDSFGNEELRARRKDVVSKVERALEDLEQEVEGRWMSKQSKQAREQAKEEEAAATPLIAEVAPETSTPPQSTTVPAISDGLLSSPVDAPMSTPDASSPVPLVTETVSSIPEELVEPVDDVEVKPEVNSTESSISVSATEDLAETDAESVADGEPASSYPPQPAPDQSISSGTPEAIDQTSTYPPASTVSSSVATLKPTQDDEIVEPFLLSAQPPEPSPKNAGRKVEEVDPGSDWSEVEA